MSLQVDSSIDYSSHIASHSSYRLNRVYPLSTQTVTAISSVVETQFEIPQKVINLSKSTIDFDMVITPNALNTNTTYTNTLGLTMFDSISLLTREGLEIARIYNADVYTRSVLPIVTPLKDYLDYPPSLGISPYTNLATAAAISGTQDKGFNLFKANYIPSTANDKGVTIPVLPGAPPGTPYATGAAADIYVQPTGTRIAAGGTPFKETTIPFSEFNYVAACNPMTANAADNSGGLYRKYSIPLKLFVHTLLSVDKDLYFGQAIVLRVNWNPIQRTIFEQAANNTATITPLAITSTTTYNNIRLYLAVEQNPIIIESIVKKVQSEGLSIEIPFVHSYLYSTPSGNAFSHQQRINISHGLRCLNVYHVVANANAANTGNLQYDISNVNSTPDGTNMAKVNTVNPSLNSTYLSEFVMNELNGEVYDNQKQLLKGCCIQSLDNWQQNRVFQVSFREGASCSWPWKDCTQDGLDLNVEQNFSFDWVGNTSSTPYRSFLWFVCQRKLNIAPGGVISML